MVRNPADNDRLTEIEFEIKAIHKDVLAINKSLTTNFAPAFEVQYLKLKVEDLEASSVTKEQFQPVKLVVMTAVALVLTSFFGALITFVITKGAGQ